MSTELELIARLAENINGCPCHCNFCGGGTDDWRGHTHDDDCPWVEAQLLLDPHWAPAPAEWLQPCTGHGKGCELNDLGIEHSYQEHGQLMVWQRAVEAHAILDAHTGEEPHTEHAWLDGHQGYGDRCAIPGDCGAFRDMNGHVYSYGEWHY